jgi:acetyl-CoA carboxylase carboxyl transferase subunit beta
VGDIIMAEPKCMIGFAGPRVIKETTHQNLPTGFQTAEFMMDHGLVDMIVERRDIRNRLADILDYLAPSKAA